LPATTITPWLAHRSERSRPTPLHLEQRFSAAEASPMLATLAEWAAPARVSAAYPGLWVREDVYATHGHYLDCHLTVPTIERLGIAAMSRMMRRPAHLFTGPDDYEAVTGPVFAWIDAIAQQQDHTPDIVNGAGSARAWRMLSGGARREDTDARADGGPAGAFGLPARLVSGAQVVRARALAGAFPLAVAALNRTGLGTFHADISSPELRRAGLRAMGEVAARLGLGEAYAIFGHTHRMGPLPHDEVCEWRAPGGARLHNTGCWTYDAYFLNGQPGENPYWPGGAVLVEDEGPPVLRRLLSDRTQAELVATEAR
jgi:hypothetical protein